MLSPPEKVANAHNHMHVYLYVELGVCGATAIPSQPEKVANVCMLSTITCMYVCLYVYFFTTCIHIFEYSLKLTGTCMQKSPIKSAPPSHTHRCAYMCVYVCVLVHTYTQCVCVCWYIHIYIDVYTHTYMEVDVHLFGEIDRCKGESAQSSQTCKHTHTIIPRNLLVYVYRISERVSTSITDTAKYAAELNEK